MQSCGLDVVRVLRKVMTNRVYDCGVVAVQWLASITCTHQLSLCACQPLPTTILGSRRSSTRGSIMMLATRHRTMSDIALYIR